ncbi:UDP-glucose 4-epimerase GalE [Tautonia sociabilis]|uniref:UDP-glucose 4-epimerase n=1 Tax=Tautonia sociabilis TaxID=2080755 RepID=A0A432MFQ5_9BACT|nr:UDP-glucose 4-epimerase GalE [Tautonia sociabilis]RUL84928.1 UDP-glucose 4-epimerase GalE [Tautonia sociabilis]
MKIVLTGGAGYIGSACLRWLLDHGHDPIAFDDLSEGNPPSVPADRLVVGDILDTEAMAEALRRHRAEAVMHFAALAIVPDSVKDPDNYYRVNVLGTKSVLDAMRRANVPRIVFSSTCATYGTRAEMPLTEQSPQAPEHPYGTTKLAAERMIQDYASAYGLGYAILRYFNAAGADPDGSHGEDRRHETHLIPLTLQVAAGRRPRLLIYGDDWPTRDGTCVRDYIHTADLADAHQKAVEAIGPGDGRVYVLGSGHGATVLEVVTACEEVVGRPIPVERTGRRPGDPPTLIADPSKIASELGWSPRYTDIRAIVETAWRWLSTHPEGYGPKPGRH